MDGCNNYDYDQDNYGDDVGVPLRDASGESKFKGVSVGAGDFGVETVFGDGPALES